MDTSFMDKLAQKFTAQEMIKANTAAETEELDRLKAQVEQYTACLNRLQEVCGEAEQYRSCLSQLQEVCGEAEQYRSCLSQLQEVCSALEQSASSMQEKLDAANNNALAPMQRKLETIQESLTELAKSVDMQDDLPKVLEERHGDLMEFTHKEGVKIYRNVQASVQEETAKQAESVNGTVKKLQGKLSAVMGISIAALLAALAGTVLQVLTLLGVL